MSALPPLWREARVPGELRALQRDPVIAGVGVPKGEDQPVMLIPGYLAGDASLMTMSAWLRRIGYRTSRAGIGVNTDCSTASVTRLQNRLERLADRHGRPVAIVGQSRGGSFARSLALRRPDLVSGIVCLGSPLVDPLAIHPLMRLNVTIVAALGSFGLPHLFSRSCIHGDCCADLRQENEIPFPDGVGFVSIFSRSDGVVRWETCLDPAAEHVAVDASHVGMSVNAAVYRVVAQSLPGFWAAAEA